MRHLALISLVLLAAPALAQDGPASKTPAPALMRALELPKLAHEARELGAPEPELRQVLDKARKGGLSAGESADVLEAEVESVKEHGQIDNFGAFVGERLDEGLRGKELSAAIRAEHQARGKGQGQGQGQGKEAHEAHQGAGHPQGEQGQHGKSEQAGDDAHGQPAKAKGPAEGKGRPAAAGAGKGSKQRPAGK